MIQHDNYITRLITVRTVLWNWQGGDIHHIHYTTACKSLKIDYMWRLNMNGLYKIQHLTLKLSIFPFKSSSTKTNNNWIGPRSKFRANFFCYFFFFVYCVPKSLILTKICWLSWFESMDRSRANFLHQISTWGWQEGSSDFYILFSKFLTNYSI